MACVVLAHALSGALIATLSLFPLVGGSAPIVTESLEHNIFSLDFSPICIELGGVSALAVHKAGSGGDFRISDGRFDCFYMACVVLAHALSGTFIAAGNFFPLVGGSVPIVTESVEHNIFSLSFCPSCAEFSGVSALAVHKAGGGGDFRIGDGCFIGFHMVCIVLAHALCGALIAAGNFFPLVGGSVPIVTESVENNIFSLSFRPSCAEFSGVSALAVYKAGCRGDFRIGDGRFIGFHMACVVLADALCGTFVAAGNFFPVVGGSVPIVTESVEHNIFSLSFSPICIELGGVSSFAVHKAGGGGDFRIGDGCFIGFHMACVVLAHALSGTFVAAVRRRPVVGGSVPVVTESVEHNIFSLSFCPICIELGGVSAFAVHKAGSGGDFRISDGCFIGFHMVWIVLAHALCGAFIAAGNFFPVVGGSVPVVTESVENNIFSLGFCPSCAEFSGVSTLAVH